MLGADAGKLYQCHQGSFCAGEEQLEIVQTVELEKPCLSEAPSETRSSSLCGLNTEPNRTILMGGKGPVALGVAN